MHEIDRTPIEATEICRTVAIRLDGNTKHQTCHLRGGALQEFSCFRTGRNEKCVRYNERIPIRCSRPGQMSAEFSSNFHKTPRALICRVSGHFNQSRAKYLLFPAIVTTLKNVQVATAKCRGTLQSCCKATVTPGCNTANSAECVPLTRVSTSHSRATSLPREALQASLHSEASR